MPRPDPYAALRHRDFRLLLLGQIVTAFGGQMVSYGIAWELWLRTHNELALGLVGLAQVIPVILFSLPGGHVADHHNRKHIIVITQILLAFCSLGLALLSATQGPLALVYLALFGIGLSRAFYSPATSTLLPQTVPPELFTKAATWMSTSWQIASITGPAFAGLMIALTGGGVTTLPAPFGDIVSFAGLTITKLGVVAELYLFDALAGVMFIVFVLMIKGRPLALAAKAQSLESLKEGVRFIRGTKVILAAITLDMFAVLFGGAVALLPVYATDILQVGAEGLGIMRAAPSIGALGMALVITRLPPFQHAGRTLLIAVAGFGIATIIFGVSTNFLLSVVMLFALGALDNISVVIRSTLILTWTPDEMRGRTSAVNNLFIGASNELGSFESGTTAALLGTVPAVVIGGIGTILVVLGVAKKWEEMRNLGTLDTPDEFKSAV